MNKGQIEEDKMAEDMPVPKKRRVSLSAPKSRFVYKSEEEMDAIKKGFVPPNTEKNTKWAQKCFIEWLNERNSRQHQDELKCPVDILEKADPDDINQWFPLFIAEARRADGLQYPPRTLHQLLAGILRYMRSVNPECPNFLDKKDYHFHAIEKTCETVFRELHKNGVGVDVSHTAVVTAEEETLLWERGILNVSSPQGLLRAVFYYVGKVCCLRGGEEQRNLKRSQFTRIHSPDMYKYVENGSKNRSGGVAQLNLENKVIAIHAIKDNEPRCLVFLLDLYFSKWPEAMIDKDVFYLRPKPKAPASPDHPWFDCVPIGKNKLASMMKEMSTEAGFDKVKTNHSLRATGATAMFNAGLPEKIIQKNTGHRSLEALRKYERVSLEQEMETSRILTTLGDLGSNEFGKIKSEADNKENQPSNSVPSFSKCSIGQLSINFN
uniref:ZMYM2-like/QRICH1 C-terminal domain-containing protein n=1 Tax=Amphimedon queenslandica TaxID=400682 RepID=A0A1X7TLL5_AMPQE